MVYSTNQHQKVTYHNRFSLLGAKMLYETGKHIPASYHLAAYSVCTIPLAYIYTAWANK